MATPPDFTTGQVLTAAQMNAVGLWKITPSSVVNGTIASDGSVSFTGADPLDVLGVFTSDYRYYRIMFDYFGSVQTSLNMQFFSGTNTIFNTAVYYRYGIAFTTGGVSGNGYLALQTQYVPSDHVTTSAERSFVEMTIWNPQLANLRTNIFSQNWSPQNGTSYLFQGLVANTTQFTGFRLDSASGTITGNLQVYGYN